VPLVREQLPAVPEKNILPEPVQLNTAQAAIWGTWHAVVANPEANIVVSPADQLIQNEELFEEQIIEGLRYVGAHSEFLAIGVRPTFPNTAYGYIQMGEAMQGERLYKVKSFSEKPAPDYAKMFKESGEFLWNTGIFLWKGETMGNKLSQLAGRGNIPVTSVARQMITIAEEVQYVRASYAENLPRPLDLCILEHCENVAIMECSFGWADIGCWPELHDQAHKDADGNAVSGGAKVLFNGASNCMVYLPHEMKAIVAGLDNFLVAQKDGMLLICPNTDPDYVRRMINEAQVNLQ